MRRLLLLPILSTWLMLPGASLASCGAYGVCGTIVFLGKTADRSKAVFLSTTTTRGQYDVTPTSGVFPVDTWITTGPDTRISLSDQVANWGGTHALNYYPVEGGPIGSRVYIAGATQNPNGTVYPNDYRPPGRSTPVVVPQPVRLQTLPSATVSEKQPAQGPVVAPMVIETVTVQEPQVSEPVRGPLVPDTSGAAVREVGPVPALPGNQLSVTGQMPQQVVAPALMVDPGVSVRQTNTGPEVAPAANQTVTIQSPQVPQQVRGPELQTPPTISVRQTNTGPVVGPVANQTVAIQSPQVPPQVPGPALLASPSISVRQANLGPVVGPSGKQPEIVQGPQVPPLVQAPRDPVLVGGPTGVVTPPGQEQVGVLPTRPPTLTGGQLPTGTGRLPGTVSTRQPLQPQLGGTQNNVPDDADPRRSLQSTPRSWSQVGGTPCLRLQQQQPGETERQMPCEPGEMQGEYGHWVDVFSSRVRDDAGGLALRQRGEGLVAGLDKVIDRDLSVGLFANTERLRGTVLDEALHFMTARAGLGAYVVRGWDERWSVTGGLHVGEEAVDIGFLGFSGRFSTRVWTASAGLVGTHAFDDGWLITRLNVEHAWKRTGTGAISGEMSGLRLDVETPSSSDAFWMLSGGIELGTRLQLPNGVVVVPSIDLGVSRVVHGSRKDNPWHLDLRLGTRVQLSPITAVVLSYHRLGANRANYRSEEWRATWTHRF